VNSASMILLVSLPLQPLTSLLGRDSFSYSQPRTSLMEAWSAIRTRVEPDIASAGLQVRLTVQGSLWAAEVSAKSKAMSPLKHGETLSWLRDLCGRLREEVKGGSKGSLVTEADRQRLMRFGMVIPPDVYQSVVPRRWTFWIRGSQVTFVDHVDVPLAYESYRSSSGVRHFGKPLAELLTSEVSHLERELQLGNSFWKVLNSVSSLEGGFEAVNSFDTGYLSVGLLQFAALEKGSGSLGRLMLRFKAMEPDEYHLCFGQYGIDVDQRGQIMAWSPKSMSYHVGPMAALLFHQEPVYAAIFRTAAENSAAFRKAQVLQAFHEYFPKGRILRIKLNGGVTIRANAEVAFRSEAALACCMDHIVKTGSMSGVEDSIQSFVQEGKVRRLMDVGRLEGQIIRKAQLRKDFLADRSLSQP
jgi:hypothetical protein